MTIERVHPDHIRIALERAEGKPFEQFANAFYSSIVGSKFVPLGGIKDGGADARDGQIFGDADDPGSFYQASVTEDPEGKIRRTVARIKEFGRRPTVLIYLTSQTVRYSDRIERSLTKELNVTIAIRDGGYIALHINDDSAMKSAYYDYLRHYTDHLRQIGVSSLVGPSKHVKTPAVYVFLANEVQRRGGDQTLVNSVTDALALWALEGTDPDKGILRTADEVLTRISKDLPSVKELVGPRLEARLQAMGKKDYPGGRAVKWHRQEGGYCLPYEVRQRIEEENTADEVLRMRILEQLEDRIKDNPTPGMGSVRIRQAAETAMRALQLAFERQGLEFAVYIRDGEGEYSTITEALKEALIERGHNGALGQSIGDAAFIALRGVLYDSTADERRYLQTLSRTYALLFTLNTEPRLLQFFQDMSSDFRLYVGADQIVRALSEHFVPEPDQMTRNTLLIAARAGAKLILTEPVLGEVVNHLRTADHEYFNHIEPIEDRLNYDIAREAPQIMLRAYLYARINPDLGRQRPTSWPGFVQRFCTHSTLHRTDAFDDLRQYLQSLFGFQYESTSDLEGLVDLEQVSRIADDLATIRKGRPELARNDALLALAVYGKRHRRGETSRVTEFGWGTWWLTGETRILRLTTKIVQENRARYIMRPEFLLNFLGMAPSAEKARRAFASVFPSMLGIQLARRMPSDTFNQIIDKAVEAEGLDDSRRTVEIAKLTNRLKSDVSRQYLVTQDDIAVVDLVAQKRDESAIE
ncbi:hypothetical protein ACQP0C_25460 [Nocardia sp. CA-129566]|uniref:hypothetical protein n=1 Tax=Nocardia sp. CA-129566 TaxID=3239976 RepID=UPI003D97CE0E